MRKNEKTGQREIPQKNEFHLEGPEKKLLRHPVAISVMVVSGLVVTLYGLSWLLDATAKAAESYRKLQSSLAGRNHQQLPLR